MKVDWKMLKAICAIFCAIFCQSICCPPGRGRGWPRSAALAGPRSPPPRRPGARSPAAGSAQSAGHRTGSQHCPRGPGHGSWSAWRRKTRSKRQKPVKVMNALGIHFQDNKATKVL